MPEIEEITASDIVKPMLDSHPNVRPNAVQAEMQKAGKETERKTEPSKAEVFKDKTGEKFNPKKHYADQYGRPQLTSGGYFKKIPLKKRLKRQAMDALKKPDESERLESEHQEEPKASEPPPEKGPEPETQSRSYIPEGNTRGPQTSEKQASDEYTAAAKAICSTIFTIGVSVGGVQCKPLPQHVESMESSWENYFRARGKIDVPPGVAVALSTGGYALFCYQSSQLVQEQVGGLRGWLIEKIGNWRTKRAARRSRKQKSAE